MSEGSINHPLTPHLSAEARYRDDPTFHAMVDMMTSVIAKLEMTPVEVREAAIYACIRYEHLNMREICRYARGGPVPPAVEADMRRELDLCQERARDLAQWLSSSR